MNILNYHYDLWSRGMRYKGFTLKYPNVAEKKLKGMVSE